VFGFALFGGDEATQTKVSNSMDMGAEKALNQANFYETDQNKILINITEGIENQSDSDLYGNGLLKFERSDDEEESGSSIWENKYIITNKEQFIDTLDESLPCLRIVLPNPTEALTVIGREILNYCSNYGEDVNRK
jgi:hypothetical protein